MDADLLNFCNTFETVSCAANVADLVTYGLDLIRRAENWLGR